MMGRGEATSLAALIEAPSALIKSGAHLRDRWPEAPNFVERGHGERPYWRLCPIVNMDKEEIGFHVQRTDLLSMSKVDHNSLPREMRPDKVGQRLALLRESMDLSKTDVCNRLGIDRSAYTKYESGGRALPPGTAYQLADLFGVDLDFLYLGRTRGLPLDVADRIGLARRR